MGLFKQLGSKLKRVISLKNLVNVGTGNFSAVAKDAVRVATSNAPLKKGDPFTVDTTFLKPDYIIPIPAMDVIEGQGKVFGSKVSTIIAKQSAVQNTNDFFTKVYIESMYMKYKNWIMVAVAIVVSFVLFKVLRSKKPVYRGRYKK